MAFMPAQGKRSIRKKAIVSAITGNPNFPGSTTFVIKSTDCYDLQHTLLGPLLALASLPWLSSFC
jgi:hypothetical protein